MTYPVLPANGPSGYNLTNSLRFRSSASAYLNRTPASAGNRQIMTYSFWVKRGAITGDYNLTNATTDASNSATLYFNSSNNQTFDVFLKVGGTNYSLTTSQVFRDPSAWYHIVVAIDTTQATASNRTKVYVNGTQVTAFLTANYVPQNSNLALNNNVAQYIGYSSYFDGYMAEINFIDGQALTPSSFGSTNATTGVWQPAKYTGTYGTNGFYLKFSNIALTSGSNTGLGQDYSGNGNYWNTNNISVTSGTTYDAMTDVPTLTSATVANYCVANPLDKSTNVTVTNGNMTVSTAVTNAGIRGSMYVSSGKYYWEATCTTKTSYPNLGIADAAWGLINVGSSSGSYGYAADGLKYNNGSTASYGATYTSGDVIGVALDLDAGTLVFYKNNTSQGTAYSSLSGTFAPAFAGQGSDVWNVNFGQRPFTYTPPTGYVALNTYNLPTSTIVQGNKYMDATLYAGNTTTVTATNAGGFKPDLVWIKDRTSVAQHVLTDSVRGTSAQLFSSLTNAEQSNSTYVTSFNSNGFTVGVGNSGTGVVNNSGDNFVGWQWQAGQGSTSSNTSGSITSTVSVNASAGFSIVTYTGTLSSAGTATVGHGLGVAPAMIITKSRSATSDWNVMHKSLPNWNYQLFLNATNAQYDSTANGSRSAPTSSVFTTNWTTGVNINGVTTVAYCWAAISGFSAFGSYTGNGSADGSFIYTGFQPAFVLIKVTSTVDEWVIFDNKRPNYNATNLRLNPNSSGAEQSTQSIDILSNGFKARSTGANINQSGATYIYACFASNPFRNSNAF